MNKAARLLTVTAVLTAALCACTPSDPTVVRTKSGLVKGIEEEGTWAFLGIPYAKVERFMPPLPVDKWDTVMVCDHFGPMVMQGGDAIWNTRKAPVYMYMFTWKSPADQGSVHGYELNFCFNTPDRHGRVLPEPSEADRQLAENMSRSWANFAITGDPNVDDLPEWKPYTAENGECFIFDHECSVRNNFDRPLQSILNDCCFRQLDAFRASHQ